MLASTLLAAIQTPALPARGDMVSARPSVTLASGTVVTYLGATDEDAKHSWTAAGEPSAKILVPEMFRNMPGAATPGSIYLVIRIQPKNPYNREVRAKPGLPTTLVETAGLKHQIGLGFFVPENLAPDSPWMAGAVLKPKPGQRAARLRLAIGEGEWSTVDTFHVAKGRSLDRRMKLVANPNLKGSIRVDWSVPAKYRDQLYRVAAFDTQDRLLPSGGSHSASADGMPTTHWIAGKTDEVRSVRLQVRKATWIDFGEVPLPVRKDSESSAKPFVGSGAR